MKPYYITTTLPYVNAKPHIGFALEIVQADILARHKRNEGREVFFNTGTDEHGLKIYQKAQEEKMETQAYTDKYAATFDNLKKALNLSYDNFIRTTDESHKKAAQEFWRRCGKNGDIYKKNYKLKYCVGCELEKTDSELEKGRCSIHPNLEVEVIEEENYFFKFSKYQEKLLALYNDKPEFVIPQFRLNEVKRFIENGLEDFSISRLKEKMPWGVSVPGDETQVMYVWFDALINYISALGWPDEDGLFKTFWPGVQVAGKDNVRQQSAMWQAMLMSAGLAPSKQIFIHGFITSGGQKMSKSLGNVIDPFEIVEKYGTDAVRYFLARHIHPFEDSDVTTERFKEAYNADLANGIGNFIARITTLGEKAGTIPEQKVELGIQKIVKEIKSEVFGKLCEYKFNEALESIQRLISYGDRYINDHKVWAIKDENAKKTKIYQVATLARESAQLFEVFIPETAEKIRRCFEKGGKGIKITKTGILFPRVE